MQNFDDPSTKKKPIKPLAFSLENKVIEDKSSSLKSSIQKSYFMISILMVAALVAVFFFVPKIAEKNITYTQPAPIQHYTKKSSVNKNQSLPYSAEEINQQRRKIQEIVQNILQLQEDLTERNVKKWASNEYSKSRSLTEESDTIYRKGNFNQALIKYRHALSILESLRKNIPEKIEYYLENGNTALNTGDIDAAHFNFDMVLAISNKHPRGLKGKERADLLPKAWEKFISGKELFKENKLNKALNSLKKALSIDPLTQPAIDLLSRVKAKILERNYKESMSAGYESLANNKFLNAQKSFLRAQKLKPNEKDPATGIAQAKSGAIQDQIDQLFYISIKLEQQEKWHKAEENYDKMLDLDPSLVLAITGKARTEARAIIDEKLQSLLEDPLSLSQSNRNNYAQKVLADAQALKANTPRIKNQIKNLKNALDQSSTPLSAYIMSDSLTEVSIYHIGNLGSFKERKIKIKPGRYTVIGTRKGYRDVRKEFIIDPSYPPYRITILCKEKIISTG